MSTSGSQKTDRDRDTDSAYAVNVNTMGRRARTRSPCAEPTLPPHSAGYRDKDIRDEGQHQPLGCRLRVPVSSMPEAGTGCRGGRPDVLRRGRSEVVVRRQRGARLDAEIKSLYWCHRSSLQTSWKCGSKN